ncbi:MAG: SurA N-terminal domain-containing protein [Chlamydiae bacterium]|nr:SurA N-terminal domain-containing protein [Chlamydiota bacterium]MBI3276520.1 SurA N-terminal domain-containing protein [Chlamydiota bacterium]
MLDQLRKNRKLILLILLILIVPPFIFFGIESAFVKKEDPILAVISGDKIRLSNFLKAKTNVSAILSLEQGRPPDERTLTPLTWQRLIFLKKAQEGGLIITDAELSEAIQKKFGMDGKPFDLVTYENILKQGLHLSVFDFEKSYREALVIQKFQDALTELVQVSDEEIQEAFFYDREKREVLYCEIPSERFTPKVTATDSELKDFFDKNQEVFRIETQRQVRYVSIPLKDLESQVKISQEEIESYYHQHEDSFKKSLNEVSGEIEKTLKRTQIEALGKKKARKIYQKLIHKKSFKSVAQKFNILLEKTGYFTEKEPATLWKNQPQTLQNIFQNELKTPLKPVLINGIYYVIVPFQEKASYIPIFEKAKDKVRSLVLSDKAKEEAHQAILSLEKNVKEIMTDQKLSFEEACKSQKEKVLKLAPFTRSESELSSDPFNLIKKAAWTRAVNQASEPQGTQNGYALFIVKESLAPAPEEFEKLKTAYKARILARKKQKVLYGYYQSLTEQCKFYDTGK